MRTKVRLSNDEISSLSLGLSFRILAKVQAIADKMDDDSVDIEKRFKLYSAALTEAFHTEGANLSTNKAFKNAIKKRQHPCGI